MPLPSRRPNNYSDAQKLASAELDCIFIKTGYGEEIKVRLRKESQETANYQDGWEDAWDTAVAMYKHHHKLDQVTNDA